jgi:hypothetical protein
MASDADTIELLPARIESGYRFHSVMELEADSSISPASTSDKDK